MRDFRAQTGQSQEDLAEYLDTSQGNLSRWERDASHPQDAATLLRIEEMLNLSRHDFIDVVVATVARNTRAHLHTLFEGA